MILTMTYMSLIYNDLPALIFVSGTIQALFNASPMVPINGEHSPRVGIMFRPIVTRYLMLRSVDLARTKTECFDRVRIDA